MTNFQDVPKTWSKVPLGELLDFIVGGDWGEPPEYVEPDYVPVLCIRASEVKNWKIDKGSTAALRRVKRSSLETRQLREGDLIIEISGGGPQQPVGRTLLIDRECLAKNAEIPKICTNFFRLMRPSAHINPSYLQLFLEHFYASGDMSRYQGGSNNLRNLKFNDYLTIEVPIAPRTEQSRIVSKVEELLSELESGVEALTSCRRQLESYRQAVLKHAFEGRLTKNWRARHPDSVQTPAARISGIRVSAESSFGKALANWRGAVRDWENGGKKGQRPTKPQPRPVSGPEIPEDLAAYCTDEWAWLPLGALSDVTGGLTKNPKRAALPRTMKYLRVANVYADRLELDEVTTIGVTEGEFRNVRLQPGDMLIVEGNGSVEQIGRVAVWGGEIRDVGHQNHLIRVRFIPGMSPRFFLAFLMSPLGRDLIVRQASSTSGLHTLSISKVSGLPVPVPPVEEQETLLAALTATLSGIERLVEEIEAGVVRCSAVRHSILKQAFSGQLGAQNPKDEPASVLLERIRTHREERPSKNERASKNRKRKAA